MESLAIAIPVIPERRPPLPTSALLRMSIKRRYWEADLKDFESCSDQRYFAVLAAYAAKAKRLKEKGWNLLLLGEPGVGKTHGVAALLKELRHRKFSVYQIVAADIQSTAFEEEIVPFAADEWGEPTSVRDYMRNVDFLAIDDLGREHLAHGGFGQRYIENLLRHRYQSLLPTIVTTNLNAVEIATRYGQAIVELLRGGTTHTVDSNNRRDA